MSSKKLIVDDEGYNAWFEELKNELNNYLTASSGAVSFCISKNQVVSNCLKIDGHMNYKDITNNIKSSSPNCISYREIVNRVNDFSNTEIFDLLSRVDESSPLYTQVKKLLDELIQEFNFLKLKVIGYEIYLHYLSVTYRIDTGYVSNFRLKENQNNEDEDEDFYDYEDEEETEEEKLEREAYEKQMEETRKKIEIFARELSQDKRLALTKNKDQRQSFARLFFKERLDKSWDDWGIEAMVVRAVNIFELEILPNLVLSLIKENKTAKQISDELGISLAKAKKLIAAVNGS